MNDGAESLDFPDPEPAPKKEETLTLDATIAEDGSVIVVDPKGKIQTLPPGSTTYAMYTLDDKHTQLDALNTAAVVSTVPVKVVIYKLNLKTFKQVNAKTPDASGVWAHMLATGEKWHFEFKPLDVEVFKLLAGK